MLVNILKCWLINWNVGEKIEVLVKKMKNCSENINCDSKIKIVFEKWKFLFKKRILLKKRIFF